MQAFYAHPTALVDSDDIGADTRIWAFVHVLAGAHVGACCNIGDHSFIEGGAYVGDNVTIKNGNAIWEGVTLEDGVFVGPRVFFTNDLYPRSARMPEAAVRYHHVEWLARTRVGRGASLGAGAIVVAGHIIGEYAMVAAGALVTKDVPAYALMLGSPAIQRGWVCRCGMKLTLVDGVAHCDTCGLRYCLVDGRLALETAPADKSG